MLYKVFKTISPNMTQKMQANIYTLPKSKEIWDIRDYDLIKTQEKLTKD